MHFRAGFIVKPEDYLYSSAQAYKNIMRLIGPGIHIIDDTLDRSCKLQSSVSISHYRFAHLRKHGFDKKPLLNVLGKAKGKKGSSISVEDKPYLLLTPVYKKYLRIPFPASIFSQTYNNPIFRTNKYYPGTN